MVNFSQNGSEITTWMGHSKDNNFFFEFQTADL